MTDVVINVKQGVLHRLHITMKKRAETLDFIIVI